MVECVHVDDKTFHVGAFYYKPIFFEAACAQESPAEQSEEAQNPVHEFLFADIPSQKGEFGLA